MRKPAWFPPRAWCCRPTCWASRPGRCPSPPAKWMRCRKTPLLGGGYYRSPGSDFGVQISVVLMGTDHTSIHQPQYCLYAQDWNVTNTERIALRMERPFPYDIPAIKLTATPPAPGERADGRVAFTSIGLFPATRSRLRKARACGPCGGQCCKRGNWSGGLTSAILSLAFRAGNRPHFSNWKGLFERPRRNFNWSRAGPVGATDGGPKIKRLNSTSPFAFESP